VKWAVAGATVVCLAAVARTSMTSKAAPPPAIAAVSQSAPTPEQAAAPKAAEPAASPAATETSPAPTTSTTESTAATAAPTEPPVESSATSTESAPAAPVTGDAKEEKVKARTLLERRKIAEAIEAGERSVALDPTDGEAWLILGAAYQEKGNLVEARRAYSSCLKEGKSGPRHECAKMLR
jgi:Flp pilus assembly protein TadD